MTWDIMFHEKSKLENFVEISPEDKRVVGFSLKGMTYDGDGNIQEEGGTSMVVTFRNPSELKAFSDKLRKVV